MKLKDYRTHPNPNPKHPKSLSDKTREDVIYDMWSMMCDVWYVMCDERRRDFPKSISL